MAFGTFSFAVRMGSSSDSSTQHTTTNRLHSQITTPNPVSHIPTLKGGVDPCSTTTGKKDTGFYWNHVYDVNNGNPNWSRNPSRLDTKIPCVTVTGTVSSAVGSGTKHDPDGDLHFSPTLDSPYTHYSVPNDCHPSKAGCTEIIVEVICHTTAASNYKQKWGDYCGSVNPARVPLSGTMPPQGARLSVSGRLVNDKDNS